MKIAMIGQKGIPSKSGGIEKYVEELSKRLVKMGHQVDVFCRPHYTKNELSEYEGIRLIHRPSINTKHLDAIVHTAICSFESLFKSYDIIHYNALGPAALSPIARINKKVVVTVHGLDWKRGKWGNFAKYCLKIGEYAVTNFSNEIIVVSQVLQKYFYEKYKKNTHYIPNGVEISEPLEPELIKNYNLTENEYILFLARLVPEKGCHYLIDAYNSLQTSKKLVIAGASSHSDEYVNRLKENSSEKIIFLGEVSGNLLKELYSNAYIYVLPSEIEGLPITLLEAMGYGKCVLTSDIPENIEVINNHYGFNFKSKDTESLKNVLDYLLENPNDVSNVGLLAKAKVGKYFNWDIIAEQTEQVYLKAISTDSNV